MATDGKHDFILMLGDVPLGEIQVAPISEALNPELPGFAGPANPDGLVLSCKAPPALAKCRSRKRFIKLLGGTMGIQRNDARYLAEVAFRGGCRSYFDLWCDCYTFLVGAALQFITNPNERKEDAK